VLIVLSDGGDNASLRSLDQVMKLAGQSSAVLYSIGLFDPEDLDQNPGVLKRLAQETGEALLPKQPGNVVAICERIAWDTFFRPLGRFEVESLRVVEPGENVLTLVTCYPFYYVGPAPKRFIVRARLVAP
jgi:hypothetical protein